MERESRQNRPLDSRADFARLGQKVGEVERCGADRIHVM